MLLLHYHETHQTQIDLHRQLLYEWDTSTSIFDIQKKETETSTKIEGIVNHIMREEDSHRIYLIRPAQWIQIGELGSFDEE